MNLRTVTAAAVLALTSLLAGAGCAAPAADDTASGSTDSAVLAAKPIVVTAIAKVKPGTEDAFEAAAEKLVAATHHEPGNLGDALSRSKDDPTTFLFYERWASETAEEDHMNGAAVAAFFAEVKDDFEPGYPQLAQYELVK